MDKQSFDIEVVDENGNDTEIILSDAQIKRLAAIFLPLIRDGRAAEEPETQTNKTEPD